MKEFENSWLLPLGFAIGILFTMLMLYVNIILPQSLKQAVLTFNSLMNNKYEIIGNKKLLGHLIMMEDGYFYCQFAEYDFIHQAWSNYALEEIVNKLEELNRPIKEQLNQYFKQQNTIII